MYSFVCRIMVVVFLLNCLVPNYGWGQTTRRSKTSLDAQLEQTLTRAQQENGPAVQFAKAAQQARLAHNEHFAEADKKAKEQTAKPQPQEYITQMLQAVPPVARDATHVAPRVLEKEISVGQTVRKNFLAKLSSNRLQFKDLIEYADPMDPELDANDLTTIAYAAEMIGNSVDEAAQLDPSLYDISELQSLLPQVQARLLYRLALLGYVSPFCGFNKTIDPVSISREKLEMSVQDSILKTEALGSLRLALLKVHRFYQKKGMADPVDEYQKQAFIAQTQAGEEKEAPTIRRWVEQPNTLAVKKNIPQYMKQEVIQKEAASGVDQYGALAVFQQNFLDELKKLRKQDPEEGSEEFEHLQILVDYATTYAVEYNPAGLKDIVALLDGGVDETDFKQQYSPILNAIFISIFENTRYSSMGEAKTKQVLSLLEEFSDPQKYSLPTRVFALEAAGLLFRPFNADMLQNEAMKPLYASFTPLNLNKPDESLRRTFALRVSELYCPLITTNRSAMDTYGLDAKQMQKLADKLAYIYDGFYDIQTPLFEDAAKSTHLRDDFPTKCHIFIKNQPNQLKVQQDNIDTGRRFTLEALFWVYGGEAFALLGTAFRLTRGAVAALPKAGKAYRLATRGEKIAAFNNEVRNGAKFRNWIGKNRKQQGYFVEVAVKPHTKAVVPASQRGATVATKYIRVDHTYQLQNKYAWWNPKRWFGITPNEKVVGMRVTRLQPNFNVTVAEANFANGEFANGLHSMQDIEKAWSQLRLVTDKTQPMLYETKPYFSAIWDLRQAQMEQALSQGLEKSFKNSMEVLAPVSNLPPTKKFKFGIDVLFEGERAWTAEEIAANTKWWSVTRWGNPYQSARTNMKVFVSARSSAIPNTPVPGGIDLPANLPGFTTTLERMATGQWRQDAFKAFFKPMNWTGTPANSQLLTNYGTWGRRLRQTGRTLGRVFLPDYLPTKLFWQVAKTSPMFAVKMIPQLIWRQRFVGTSIALGLWEGSDYIIYLPYRYWMVQEATKDTQAETQKYGDTFSKQQAKNDEQLMKNLGIDTSDKQTLTTYQDVLQAQAEQKSGTLITAPIVVTRRALNDVPILNGWGIHFVDDATKASYAHEARHTDFNRARLKQMNIVLEQTKSANDKARQESERAFKAAVDAAYESILAKYPRGFVKIPQAKQQLRALFDKYIQDSFAAQTTEEQNKIDEQVLQQKNQILSPVGVWDMVLEDYEQEIQELRDDYSSSLVTEEVQQQIWTSYDMYATEYIRTVLPLSDQMEQITKDYLLQKKRELGVNVVREQLKDEWNAQYPAEAYKKILESYPNGFAALPQYKEPLKQLFAGFAADMNAAQTEAQKVQIRERFHKQCDEMMDSVSMWERIVELGEKFITNAKQNYGNLLTPAIEQQIKAIYEKYAEAYIQQVLPLPVNEQISKRSELLKKRTESISAIFKTLQKQLEDESSEETFAEEEPEYGSEWDNNLEEE